MTNKKFKEVFELSNQLQEKNNRKLYNQLSKIDKEILTFDEFTKQEKKKLEKEISAENKKLIEESYLAKDSYTKETIQFDLYLFHHTHIEEIEFDNDYKPFPLKQKDIFEYGAVVSLEDESGYYNISGVFGGIDEDEGVAKDKYNALKLKIGSSSEIDLLNEIENDILRQING